MELNAIAKSAIFFIFVIVCEKMMSYGSLFSSSVLCCSHQVTQTKKIGEGRGRAILLAPPNAGSLI